MSASDEVAAIMRLLLQSLPERGPRDVAVRRQVEGAATALEALRDPNEYGPNHTG